MDSLFFPSALRDADLCDRPSEAERIFFLLQFVARMAPRGVLLSV